MVKSNTTASCKRRLEDSGLDDTHETPRKRPYSPVSSASPDLACVLDTSDALQEVEQVPSSSLMPAEDLSMRFGQRKGIGLATEEGQFEQLNSVPSGSYEKFSCTVANEGQSSPLLRSTNLDSPLVSRKETVDLGPAFDFDVDEILCLSPIDCDVGERISGIDDFIAHGQNFYGEPDSLCLRGCSDSMCLMGQSSKQCQRYSTGEGENESVSDEGYFTKSFKTPTVEKSEVMAPRTEVMQKLSPVMSTPLAKSRESVRVLVSNTALKEKTEEKEKSSAAVKEQLIETSTSTSPSSSEDGKLFNLAGQPAIPLLDDREGLEGRSKSGEEVLIVGAAVRESSVCSTAPIRSVAQSAVKTEVVVSDEKEEPQSVNQQVMSPERLVTFRGIEVPNGGPSESTLPLRIQVKSKVVLPRAQSKSSGADITQSEQRAKAAVHRPVHRPVVFERERDWERGKRIYIDSVTSHMRENTETGAGAMTELFHLMNTVAKGECGEDGRPWQHPSDLTRRNYCARRGKRLLSLDEWQRQNHHSHRRFSQVPDVFERNPLP